MSRTAGQRIRVVLYPIVVLAVAAGVCFYLYSNAPRIEPESEARPPKVVRTLHLTPKDERVAVTAHGTVMAAREVTIKPQVRGLVVRQHAALMPGGFLAEGEEIVAIDPSDYEIALTEEQTNLEEAKFEMELERGRQVVASREWRLLQGDLPENEANRSLVLREPHLRRTEARILKAENQIAKAKLDLSRTSIRAPFNAMVLQESVEKGQLVDLGDTIATLVGTDEFWVRASLRIHELRWVRFPDGSDPGSSVEIVLETGNGSPVRRAGRVVRLLSDLEPHGRLARVLISVPDPIGRQGAETGRPLLLGSYVRVEIDAGELEDVLSIPRQALRDGARIWVVGADNLLDIRPVKVVWSRRDKVLIENVLEPGEAVIVSELRVAVPGMQVNPQAQQDAHAFAAPPRATGGP